MKNNCDPKIFTPKTVELVSTIEFSSESRNSRNENQICAELKSINVTQMRLTSCCEYKKYIICAGFSGELFFVDKEDFIVERKEHVANSIIRCLRVIDSESILLISTDAGEVIVYDLCNNKKMYYEHSTSSIYNIVIKDSKNFITSEKNGNILEWEYIPEVGIFCNKKIFTAESTVFAMECIGEKLVVVNAIGEKFEYNFSRPKLKKIQLCKSNVFCVREGDDGAIYYGLSNGSIMYEETNCDICILEGHRDAVRDLVFSKNKKWMFSVSKDRTVKAWKKGVPKVITGVKDYLYQVIFDESGSYMFFVDGHGDMGRIHFSSDIDLADSIYVLRNMV